MASKPLRRVNEREYVKVLDDVAGLLDRARRATAKTVNTLMTTTYWLVGRRIVEGELKGKGRADYGDQLIERLAADLGSGSGEGLAAETSF